MLFPGSAAPSQIDTLGPQGPTRRLEVRGPFQTIATKRSGECASPTSSPKLGQAIATRSRLIRSVYHKATAVSTTRAHQMMQNLAAFSTGGIEHPHVGCVLKVISRGQRGRTCPLNVLLPRPIGPDRRQNMPHGQEWPAYLGKFGPETRSC